MRSVPPNSKTVPAALAGIAVAAVVAVIGASAQDALATGRYPDLQLLISVPVLWLFAFGVFLMGFIILGVPSWIAAHLLGWTRWHDAVLIGALLASISEFLFTFPSGNASGSSGGVDLIVNGYLTQAGWLNAVGIAAIMAGAGAAAGFVIWWWVYRSDIARSLT
jgi:hypothetical protein